MIKFFIVLQISLKINFHDKNLWIGYKFGLMRCVTWKKMSTCNIAKSVNHGHPMCTKPITTLDNVYNFLAS